jgi:hypothetical protein
MMGRRSGLFWRLVMHVSQGEIGPFGDEMSRVAASLEPASPAWCNGVNPDRFAKFIFAPALSKTSIMVVSFLITA